MSEAVELIDIYRSASVTIQQNGNWLIAVHTHCKDTWEPTPWKGTGRWKCRECGVGIERSIGLAVKGIRKGEDMTFVNHWVAQWLKEDEARVEVTVKW